MTQKLVYLGIIVVSLAGCATRTVPESMVTAHGLKSRTGLSLPSENHLREKSELPPGVSIIPTLSSDDAAAIALWNNPQFLVDLAQLGIARSDDVIEAGLLRNPRFDLLFPIGAKPFEFLLNLPIESLWERPKRIKASQEAYEQLAQGLIQNGLNTIRDARVAHAQVMIALKRQAVSEKAIALRKRIANFLDQRYKRKEITELETSMAHTEIILAQEQELRAKHDVNLATHRLRWVLGLMLSSSALDVKFEEARVDVPPEAEILVKKALTHRPDLRAAELRIAAAAQRAKWEKTRLAQLSLQLNVKEVGTHGVLVGPGLGAEIPIFHQNQGQRARADAEVELASRNYLMLKQRLAFEVMESRERLIQAQELLNQNQQTLLPVLKKTVSFADQEFKKGTVMLLPVLEQNRNLLEAELRLADSEGQVIQMQAELDRSVGTKDWK